MASENLVNDLFEIVQSNTKEKLSYDDFEKDLLKSINLPNDEVDRALSIMLSQAEVNPNVIGESKGGTFVISPSFSASIISTIKYENQFIEGKREYLEKINRDVVGVILTASLVDSMLNNFEQLTSNDIKKLYEDYSKLSDDQQRRLDTESIKRLEETEKKISQTKDETSKNIIKAMVLDAKEDSASAESARKGQIDQDPERRKMMKTDGFSSFLLKKYGIVLTENTVIDKSMMFYYNEFKGTLRVDAGRLLSEVSQVNTYLIDGNFEELDKLFRDNPQLERIRSIYESTYGLVQSGVLNVNSFDDNQKAIHAGLSKYFSSMDKRPNYDSKLMKDILPEEAYSASSVANGGLQKYLRDLQARSKTDKVIETQETIRRTEEVFDMLDGAANGFLNYGMDSQTVSEGLSTYASILDAIHVGAENGMMFAEEEPEEWGTEKKEAVTHKAIPYDEMFKSKLIEESDKTRNTSPARSDVLDVMSGVTYGGTIQDRMKDIDSLKTFSHEVSHSVKKIDKKLEQGLPFDKKPSFEIEALMEAFMRSHAEDLFVGEIPVEKSYQGQEEPAPVNDETYIATPTEEVIATDSLPEQDVEDSIDEKDTVLDEDEGLKKIDDKQEKKPGIFIPSDFGQAMNIFSNIRTSQYVSMFEDVKTPLMEIDTKKIPDNKDNQGRDDDDEPGQ